MSFLGLGGLLEGIGAVTNIFAGNEQAEMQEQMLKSQELQSKIQYSKKMTHEAQQVNNLFHRQRALQSVSGTKMSSPSFQAIQQEGMRRGAQSLRNTSLEKAISESSFKAKRKEIEQQRESNIFSSLMEGGLKTMQFGDQLGFKDL